MSDEAQETRPKVWIYALLDPETGEPRYVGKAINPQVRYAQHRYHPDFMPKSWRTIGVQA